MQLFSDCTAANHLTTFEHKRLQTTLRKITGGHEAIVTTTNDYDVISHSILLPQINADDADQKIDLRLPAFICGLNILQHLEGSISSRGAHDSATGMRRRTAHVKVFDRRAILRPARCGPQEEELLERQFALEDVSLRQSKVAFEIERRQHLSIANQALDVRR